LPGWSYQAESRSLAAAVATPAKKKMISPLPLDHNEIAGFERAGLRRLSLVEYDDDQRPPLPHFFAAYQRIAGGKD